MLLFFAVPVQAQTMTAAQKEEIEKTLKELTVQTLPLVERLDLEGFGKYWSRDKFIGYVFAGKQFTTFDSMIAEFKRVFETRKGHKMGTTDIQVRILSPEWALVWANGPWSVIRKDDTVANYLGSFYYIFVKEGGTWKIAFNTSNSASTK
jgi:hypothetical protein